MNPTSSDISSHKLVLSREFKASRERLWQAWTQPEQIQQWLGSGDDVEIESVLMDLRVGGKFRIQQKMEDGEYYTAAGTYLEVIAPERLVYTWDWEKDGRGTEFGELEGNETQVTVEFLPRGQKTEVVLTHEKFASIKSRDSHEGGWKSWMGRLAQFVEA